MPRRFSAVVIPRKYLIYAEFGREKTESGGPTITNHEYATGGTIYDVKKTTVYLPESLKREVERLAHRRSCSEAEVIRQAIQDAVARPKPRFGIIPGDDSLAMNVDEYLEGFGER